MAVTRSNVANDKDKGDKVHAQPTNAVRFRTKRKAGAHRVVKDSPSAQKVNTLHLLERLKPGFRRAQISQQSYPKSIAFEILKYKKDAEGSEKESTEVRRDLQRSVSKFGLPTLKREAEVLNDLSELSRERLDLLDTYKHLYKQRPTHESLLGELKKLPSFNKKVPKRKHTPKADTLRQQEVRSERHGHPALTISDLYKNLDTHQVAKLKEAQLLKTCQIYGLRLKNLEFENKRFDVENVQVNDEELYPTDAIYLREDGDGDAPDQMADVHWREFLFDGLKPADYSGERTFDETQGPIDI